MRIDGELEGVGSLGAERPLVDGALGVALDIDELPALGVDQLATAHGAVGTEALGDGGVAEPGCLLDRLAAERLAGGR
jgi:hypothetical protein